MLGSHREKESPQAIEQFRNKDLSWWCISSSRQGIDGQVTPFGVPCKCHDQNRSVIMDSLSSLAYSLLQKCYMLQWDGFSSRLVALTSGDVKKSYDSYYEAYWIKKKEKRFEMIGRYINTNHKRHTRI